MSEFLNGRSLLQGEYLSLVPVIRTKVTRDFELLNLIKDGLQAYDQAGEPIDIEKVDKMFETYRRNLKWESFGLSVDKYHQFKYLKILGGFLFKKQDLENLGLIITDIETSEAAIQEIPEDTLGETEVKRSINRDYVFRQEGDFYEIVFAGKPLPRSKLFGLSYIYILIQKQSEEISALELGVRSGNISEDYFSNKLKEGLEEITSLREPILDQKGLNDIRNQMKDLKDELREYEDDMDYERANIIKHQIQELEEWIIKEYGQLHSAPFRRRKDPKDSEYSHQLESSRKKVSSSIKRAIDWMKKFNEDMAEHFDKSINKGRFLCYRPRQPLDWLLE
jgi:hypothetical protein